MFSVPPSFSRAFGSPVMSQKSKIESDWETAESERSELSTTFSRVKDEHSLLVNRDLRRKSDKEDRFRNNYRLAEKQQKMRTGKCEGYSFFSIKAGLRKQDFRDTINLSPTNASKGGSRHISDVVKAVLQNAAAGPIEPSTTPGNGTVVSENEIDDNRSIEYQQSSLENENEHEHEKLDGFMNEEDWQLARSKKLKPLRSRGSNRISAQMNLDSFIDSALSEQLKENDKMEAPVDMTLNDLQSPKLIESRFGWKKVRRAVTIVRTVSSLSEKRSSAPAPAVVQSLTTESSNSTLLEIDGGSIKSSDKLNSLPSSPKHPKANKDSIEQTDTTAIVSNQTSSQKSPLPRPSTANNTRSSGSRLAFTVPESATFIRPHSAIVRPTKSSVLSVMSPLDEFIEIVRQETERSKAGSLFSNTSQLPPQQQQQLGNSAILERPKTATLRIAPPPAIITTNTTNNTHINEGNNDYLTLHNEISDDDTLRRQERMVYRNYSGLIYHDPSKTRTWEGVSEMLSPPPLLSATGDINDPFQLHRSVRSDTRWAGKTLNSYRPWSPERRTVQYSHLHSPQQSPSHIQTGEFPLMTILDTSTVQQEEEGEEESPEQQSSSRKPSARLSARLSARKQQQQPSQQQPHPLLNTSSAALTTTTSSSLPELKSHRSGYSHSGTTTPTKPHHAPHLQHVQKDAVFTSTSTLGMNSARNTPKNARPASAQGVFRPHSQSQTSPSSHFKPSVVSAETSNVRPFSARAPSSTHIGETRQLQRPATAAPSSPSSLHEEFNRSSSYNTTSIEQGGHSYSHSHSAPALSRNSLHRGTHNNSMQLASNSGISTAKAHLSGTRSTVSKRTPLLINILTRNPSRTTDTATTTAAVATAEQKRMAIKKKPC